MSNLRNGHVAVSILRVQTHNIHLSHSEAAPAIADLGGGEGGGGGGGG